MTSDTNRVVVEGPLSDIAKSYVRAALARGSAMLHARLAEVQADIASHEAELARITCERDALAQLLPQDPTP